jgi:hypothetical protein
MWWKKTSFALASIAACGLLAADVATVRSADAQDRCKKVHGTVIAHLTDPATCPSPFLLCTAGRIVGGGPLNGATTFTTLGLAPSAGMPGIVPPTTLSYAGVFVITTRRGQIQLTDVGILDQANLAFTEIDLVQGGTGEFAGATGRWFISGPVIDNGTGFRGEITGEICTP